MVVKQAKVLLSLFLILALLLSGLPIYAENEAVAPPGAAMEGTSPSGSEGEAPPEEETTSDEEKPPAEEVLPEEDSPPEEEKPPIIEILPVQEELPGLILPVIKGVKAGKSYDRPVKPLWQEEKGYLYEALLEKDGQTVPDYERGQEIWQGGDYQLSVTVKLADDSKEKLEETVSVSFSIAKTPYNTPNPGARAIKEQLQELPGNKKKVDLTLLKLYDEKMLFAGEQVLELKKGLQTRNLLKTAAANRSTGETGSDQDQVYVYVYLDKKTSSTAVKSYLKKIISVDEKNHLLTAWVELKKLEGLASLQGVKRISLVDQPVIRAVTSEGDSIHNADQGRLAFEQQGSGVKIGVISDSVDNLQVARTRGELPAVSVLENNYPYSHSDEGIALLEIVHDLAPQAELYFHDCGGDTIAFNQAITALKEAGCQIICDDVGWKHEPFFEDGLIAEHVKGITSEVIYVSSAGNSADLHYQGEYYDYVLADGSHFHDFSHGKDPSQKALLARVPWGSAIEVVMQWDDPFTHSANDYDLWVYDLTYQKYISADSGYTFPADVAQTYGLAVQDGDDSPLESFIWVNDNAGTNPEHKTVDLAINACHPTGDLDSNLEVFFYTYNSAEILGKNLVPEDSIYGHPAVPGVLAVGAIAANDPGHDEIREYSSLGPVTIRGEAARRNKPDLCGIDGVTVTWGSSGSSTYHFQGTSAAAPHVAAIAGLLKAEFPQASPELIRQVLKNSAVHLSNGPLPEPFQPNGVFGYGLADALSALQSYDNIAPEVSGEEQTITVAPSQVARVQVNEASDVYLLKKGYLPIGQNPALHDLEEAVSLYLGAKAQASAGVEVSIPSTALVPGDYLAYAVDAFNNVSAAAANEIHVIATAVNSASALSVDRVRLSLEEQEKALCTVQLKDAVGQPAGFNWVYLKSDRTASDTITQVLGAAEAIAADGWIRMLAGADGLVQFSVAGGAPGLSTISAGLDGGALQLTGSPQELRFYAAPGVSVLDSAATDGQGQYVRLMSDQVPGEVYLVKDDQPRSTIAELDAAAAGNKGEKAAVTAANTAVPVPTTGLIPGIYYAYAVSDELLSAPAALTITITDGTKPIPTTAGGSFNNNGDSVTVASSEAGMVYIVRDSVAPITIASVEAAILKNEAASGTVSSAAEATAVSTQNLRGGTYLAYAVDVAGNISEPGKNQIIIADVLPPLVVSFTPADQAVNVPPDTKVSVRFSEPLFYLGDAPITADNLAALVMLKSGDAQGANVLCQASFNADKTIITLAPVQTLAKGQVYYLAVDILAKDEAGNALQGGNTASFTIAKSNGGGGSGGGGGGGGTVKPVYSIQPITADDDRLNKELARSGKARLNLSAYGLEQASFSLQAIQQLGAKAQPLVLESTGVSLQFPPNFWGSMASLTGECTVNIKIRRLSQQEKTQLKGDNTYLDIGADIFEFSVTLRDSEGAIKQSGNFSQYVQVTMNLADVKLTAEQIAQLKGVRLEQGQTGQAIYKSLEGSYNAEQQTFSFIVDHFSYYSIMQSNPAAKIKVLEMTVGQTAVKVNGTVSQLEVPPIIINGRTMVPLRFIGEALGAQFIWAESSQTVYIVSGSKNLRLAIGETKEGLDSPPVIRDGRTMVPIRYIAEAFGAKVEWLPVTKSVLIVK